MQRAPRTTAAARTPLRPQLTGVTAERPRNRGGCSSSRRNASAGNENVAAEGEVARRAAYWLAEQLDSSGTAHTFTGAAAALLQGAALPPGAVRRIAVSVQWDAIPAVHVVLAAAADPSLPLPQLLSTRGGQVFQLPLTQYGVIADISCEFNTVVAMNQHRISLHPDNGGRTIWCESLLEVRDGAAAAAAAAAHSGDAESAEQHQSLAAAATSRLQQLQADMTAANAAAWRDDATAEAWAAKVGPPAEAAAWIAADPWLRIGAPLYRHLPQSLKGA